jgi:hypothetical protein
MCLYRFLKRKNKKLQRKKMKKYRLGEEICEICKTIIPIEVFSERTEEELYEDYKLFKDYIENLHWYNYHYICAICGKWIPSGERELLYGELLNTKFHKDYIPENNGVERVHKKCMEKLIANIK